jgi:hypothetical protein
MDLDLKIDKKLKIFTEERLTSVISFIHVFLIAAAVTLH